MARRRRDAADAELEPGDDGPSKTQLKQESLELRDLGAALMALPDALLDDIPMEDDLRAALREMRRLRGFEARRRHNSYIGKLLRSADVEPLRRALEEHHEAQTRVLRQIERWRERLVTGDEGLTAFVEAHPEGNTQEFRALVRNARKEAAAAAEQPAEAGAGKGRYYRDLFQAVRKHIEGK